MNEPKSKGSKHTLEAGFCCLCLRTNNNQQNKKEATVAAASKKMQVSLHVIFYVKHIGIDAGYQNHQAKYTENPRRSAKTNQSHDNEEHTANHLEVAGQSVGPVPVVLVVKSPRNLDSDRIILPRFRKEIS